MVEFGLLDYWINNPGSNEYLLWLKKVWPHLAGKLPVTLINASNYQALMNAVAIGQPGIVAADGTWYSESKYGQLDPDWLEAFVSYVLTYALGLFAPFAQNPTPVPLQGASSSQVTIALVGDWGTGNYTGGIAASVMKAIVTPKPGYTTPDYIIHLGDVYYAGTSSEETNNLVKMWPAAYSGKSFTLNSNHEMYSGGRGYFGALANKIFSLQNKKSYFALQYGNPKQSGGPWTIIGLDSGYWSTSPGIALGSIQGKSGSGATAQPQFLQKLVKGGLSAQNTIVLTHHNPLDTYGGYWLTDALGNNLWAQVKTAMSGPPKAWYWGHIHNGIVYPNPTKPGDSVYGRCVGHGALPFGNAWQLAATPSNQVTAYANVARPGSKLMMNGFLLLTITQTGQVTETFYQQDGTQPTWVHPYTYQLGVTAAAAGAS